MYIIYFFFFYCIALSIGFYLGCRYKDEKAQKPHDPTIPVSFQMQPIAAKKKKAKKKYIDFTKMQPEQEPELPAAAIETFDTESTI